MENLPTGVPPIEVVRAYWKLSWPACYNLKGQRSLTKHWFVCYTPSLHLWANSQPCALLCSVVNAGQPTSFSIEALFTSIGGTNCKNFPLSVVSVWKMLVKLTPAFRQSLFCQKTQTIIKSAQKTAGKCWWNIQLNNYLFSYAFVFVLNYFCYYRKDSKTKYKSQFFDE